MYMEILCNIMEVIDAVACFLGAKDLVEECKQWVVIYWQWLYYTIL